MIRKYRSGQPRHIGNRLVFVDTSWDQRGTSFACYPEDIVKVISGDASTLSVIHVREESDVLVGDRLDRWLSPWIVGYTEDGRIRLLEDKMTRAEYDQWAYSKGLTLDAWGNVNYQLGDRMTVCGQAHRREDGALWCGNRPIL